MCLSLSLQFQIINNRQNKGWGWAFPESWGVWSEGEKAKVILPLPEHPAKILDLAIKAFTSAKHPFQRVEIWLNGALVKNITLNNSDMTQIELPIPQSLTEDYLIIEFKLPDNISPQKLGLGSDVRPLGIGLISAEFR